jgi:carboxypeptidase PM20D1
MKKIFFGFMLLVAILAAIVLIRTFSYFQDIQLKVDSPLAPIEFDHDAAIQRYATSIQFPTISNDDRSLFNPTPFLQFHQHLQDSFPLVHQRAERTLVNDYSLVFHLAGSDSSLKPALFMGHMDVVPVDEATADQWQHPPFSGKIVDGVVWGRGTMDDKVSVLALMEALEIMLSKGIQPQRSLYFAFGHDEEVGGADGAAKIAEYFRAQQIEFEFVLDEGGAITEGLLAGIDQSVAIIGIAEKGYVNLKLTVNAEGGHSSQPPDHTAAGILSQAIVNIEANPFPTNLAFTQLTFNYVGKYAPFASRLAMSNLWLLSPIVEKTLLAVPSTAASIRTTTAATMLKGSSKSNILPTQATAVVNFRILPGDSVEFIKTRIKEIISDERVEIEAYMVNEPSQVSSTDSYGYRLIEKTVRALDQDVLVAPYLVQGGTDAKHFYGLSNNIYRFMMVKLTPETMKRFHGVNEQLAQQDYIKAVQFFYEVLLESAKRPEM